MQNERLQELKRLHAAATQGPWAMGETYVDTDADGTLAPPETVVRGMDMQAAVAVCLDFGPNNPTMREANAAFITALRNAAPELIAIAEKAPLHHTYPAHTGNMSAWDQAMFRRGYDERAAESRATVAAEELHDLAVLRCEEWDESGDDLQAGNWYKFDDVGLSLFAADLLAAQQAQAAPVDDVEQITERIRQIYADQPDRTKTVMYRDVCHLLGHIALLRGATPAQPQVQDTPTGQKPLPTPEQLLAVARDTGLRSYLHGVNATEARELLYVYIDAVRLLDTNYLPEPQVQPAGDAKDAARYRWLRGQSDWFANPERFDYKMSEVDAAIDAAMQSAAGGAQ